jgi:phage gpG-like protein
MAAAAPQLQVEVVGEQVAAERLLQVGERAADVRPVKPQLDPLFRRDEEARFAADGPGWTALKDSTVALKQAQGWDARILRRTGELERSLTSRTAALEVTLSGGRDELAFGTSVPYARYHQYGEGVPKRELIDLSPRTVAAMTETVQGYIVEDRRRL